MNVPYAATLASLLFVPVISQTVLRAQNNPAPAAGLPEWRLRPGSVVPGSAAMLLVGDPSKHEMFAVRFRYPDGGRIAPHWHTTSVHITVLGGTLMLGMGDVFDSTRAQAYGPGSFLVLEGGMHHFEWFRGEVTLHVEGIGPFRTVFVNPAEDPRPRP